MLKYPNFFKVKGATKKGWLGVENWFFSLDLWCKSKPFMMEALSQQGPLLCEMPSTFQNMST